MGVRRKRERKKVWKERRKKTQVENQTYFLFGFVREFESPFSTLLRYTLGHAFIHTKYVEEGKLEQLS